jgi:hypothetical protein
VPLFLKPKKKKKNTYSRVLPMQSTNELEDFVERRSREHVCKEMSDEQFHRCTLFRSNYCTVRRIALFSGKSAGGSRRILMQGGFSDLIVSVFNHGNLSRVEELMVLLALHYLKLKGSISSLFSQTLL